MSFYKLVGIRHFLAITVLSNRWSRFAGNNRHCDKLEFEIGLHKLNETHK